MPGFRYGGRGRARPIVGRRRTFAQMTGMNAFVCASCRTINPTPLGERPERCHSCGATPFKDAFEEPTETAESLITAKLGEADEKCIRCGRPRAPGSRWACAMHRSEFEDPEARKARLRASRAREKAIRGCPGCGRTFKHTRDCPVLAREGGSIYR